MALTIKERAFCRAYVKLRQGQAAAIEAGYNPRRARQEASELRRKPAIIAEIARLEAEIAKYDLMTAVEVEQKLDELIRFNLRDFVGSDGEAKPIHELTPEQAACIHEFTVIETQLGMSRKLKFFDKLTAIRVKMQRLGMLVEKSEVDVTGNVTIRIKSNVKRG